MHWRTLLMPAWTHLSTVLVYSVVHTDSLWEGQISYELALACTMALQDNPRSVYVEGREVV